ncbi:hypothetical protein BH11MYX4_BH11MYX4_45650 [soil metagenome]
MKKEHRYLGSVEKETNEMALRPVKATNHQPGSVYGWHVPTIAWPQTGTLNVPLSVPAVPMSVTSNVPATAVGVTAVIVTVAAAAP